jgi:hypothetical protein
MRVAAPTAKSAPLNFRQPNRQNSFYYSSSYMWRLRDGHNQRSEERIAKIIGKERLLERRMQRMFPLTTRIYGLCTSVVRDTECKGDCMQ